MDKIKYFWNGLTKRGKMLAVAVAVVIGMIIYGYVF
tara:strand:- start:139 stop:246 length:108 start_codon:yes stop_codon:yes gene_type:complete